MRTTHRTSSPGADVHAGFRTTGPGSERTNDGQAGWSNLCSTSGSILCYLCSDPISPGLPRRQLRRMMEHTDSEVRSARAPTCREALNKAFHVTEPVCHCPVCQRGGCNNSTYSVGLWWRVNHIIYKSTQCSAWHICTEPMEATVIPILVIIIVKNPWALLWLVVVWSPGWLQVWKGLAANRLLLLLVHTDNWSKWAAGLSGFFSPVPIKSIHLYREQTRCQVWGQVWKALEELTCSREGQCTNNPPSRR